MFSEFWTGFDDYADCLLRLVHQPANSCFRLKSRSLDIVCWHSGGKFFDRDHRRGALQYSL